MARGIIVPLTLRAVQVHPIALAQPAVPVLRAARARQAVVRARQAAALAHQALLPLEDHYRMTQATVVVAFLRPFRSLSE